WPRGRTTTTPSDHTAGSAISRPSPTPTSVLPKRNGTGLCAIWRAPRPIPLLRRARQAQINLGLCSSVDERRGSGQPSPKTQQIVTAPLGGCLFPIEDLMLI